MSKTDYKSLLKSTVFSGTSQQQKISKILDQLDKDKEATDDLKLEIETYAREISIAPVEKGKLPADNPVEDDNRKKLFPKYGFEDDLIFPDGLKEYGFDVTATSTESLATRYGKWLLNTYLPTFHPMPDASHQHPIAACLMLLNCKAVLSKKQEIPTPYLLGMNGSGKTELGKSIGQHYPKRLYTEIRPNWTGAVIREKLDELFCGGDPGYALFDNLNPRVALDRWGSHYDLILANCEESAESRISGNNREKNVKDHFKTYCYKAFTSVWGLEGQTAGEWGEINRRCIILRFQEGKPRDTRTIYDWSGQCEVFQNIWGEEFMQTHRVGYGRSLGQLARLKPEDVPIQGKMWRICQVPIAVGVYAGIFGDINEGIAHFARHFEWLKKGGSNAVGSALSIVLMQYIKEELPKAAKNPFAAKGSALATGVIPQSVLKEHIKGKTGYDVGKQEFDNVILLMNNMGYVYKSIGQDMGFVKDTPPTA